MHLRNFDNRDSLIGVSISVKGVNADDSVVENPIVTDLSVIEQHAISLVSRIFFDENSSVIPSRYDRIGPANFGNLLFFDNDPLRLHHAVLDVIGDRIKRYSPKSVTLTGANSNTAAEKGGIELSKARALAVKDYLVSTWGINPSILLVDQRNLPELPTNPSTMEGQQENRRVEITSTDSRINAAFRFESESRLSFQDALMRVEVAIQANGRPVKSWAIHFDVQGEPKGPILQGEGFPPSLFMLTFPNARSLTGDKLHYRIDVSTEKGTASAEGTTGFKLLIRSKDSIMNPSLMCFDFESSTLGARPNDVLDVVAAHLRLDSSSLSITGFTSKDESDPQFLSESRANSAAVELQKLIALPANTTLKGAASTSPKFPIDLPEGRQLNRRVEFVVGKLGK